MINEKSSLVDDIFELNKRISENLWHMKNEANENGRPSNLSPYVIFPLKRDENKTVRISEQEARIVCCNFLASQKTYYSVETPTKKRYVQKGKKPEGISAQTDLTIFGFDEHSFSRAVNVEFKAHNPTEKNIGKDIEKLVREGIQGNWFHILNSYNAGTFPALFSKFKYAFIEYPKEHNNEEFSSKIISIVFCFCVLVKPKAYMRHFFYEPLQDKYSELVNRFFDGSQSSIDKNWRLLSL